MSKEVVEKEQEIVEKIKETRWSKTVRCIVETKELTKKNMTVNLFIFTLFALLLYPDQSDNVILYFIMIILSSVFLVTAIVTLFIIIVLIKYRKKPIIDPSKKKRI